MGSSQSKTSKNNYNSSNNNNDGRRGFDENSLALARALAAEQERPHSLALSSSSSFLNHPIYLPPPPPPPPPGPRDVLLSAPARRIAKKVKKGRSRQPQAQQRQPLQRHWPLAASDHHYHYHDQNLLYTNGVSYINEAGNGISIGGYERSAFRALQTADSQQLPIPPPPDQFYSVPEDVSSLAKQRETKIISKSAKKLQQQHRKMSTHQDQVERLQQQLQITARNQMERGLALSYDERKRQGLLGLLPAAIQDQELQIKGVVNYIDHCKDELSKYVYLRNLKDFNENLFYATLSRHVEKLMPIVYTPTVGLACQKFSEIYMRPRGLFISIREAGQIAQVLANWPERDVLVIVVTDGERILGLGDLGANGMGISIGKLSLYTALAGIPPQNVLPITLDVGTNNETLLKDPLYIGLRQERIRGAQYDELVDEFMQAVVDRFGRTCLIQFEDFANSNAFALLQRYRKHFCTFNDDIQGTASVCLSGLISAARLIGRRMADCSFLFYGAGEANLGTAQLLVMAMKEEGITQEEASSRIWLVDSKGLVVSSRNDLSGHKRAFAQNAPHLRGLEEIIEYTKPQGIVGASAQGGAFNESICKKMAEYNERPIIFALSNPTSKAECTADQAYRWTEGRCVFASGSPFDPVSYNGRTYVTGQGNNAYIFPAVGLASIAARVYSIPEETFLVAARALSDQLTPADSTQGLVYPSLSKIREVTLRVATRVLEHFYSERLATYRPEPNDKLTFLKGIQYDCMYR